MWLALEKTESLSSHSDFLRPQGYEVLGRASYEQGFDLLDRKTFDSGAVSRGGVSLDRKEILMRVSESDRTLPVLYWSVCGK